MDVTSNTYFRGVIQDYLSTEDSTVIQPIGHQTPIQIIPTTSEEQENYPAHLTASCNHDIVAVPVPHPQDIRGHTVPHTGKREAPNRLPQAAKRADAFVSAKRQ